VIVFLFLGMGIVAVLATTLVVGRHVLREQAIARARQLVDYSSGRDAAWSVLAAMAVVVVDDISTLHLGQTAQALFSAPGPMGPDELEPRLRAVADTIEELDHNCAAWSNLERPVTRAARSDGVDSAALFAATLRASEASDEVHRSGEEVFAHLDMVPDNAALEPGADDFIRWATAELLVSRQSQRGSPPEPSLWVGSRQTRVDTATPSFIADARRRTAEVADPADPHAEERESLKASMSSLGLQSGVNGLPGSADYEHQFEGCSSQLLHAATLYSESIRSSIDETRTSFCANVGRPDRLEDDAHRELVEVATTLQSAIATYAARVDSLLSEVQRLSDDEKTPNLDMTGPKAVIDRVTQALDACAQLLQEHEPVEALVTAATARLPVVAAWRPSRTYQAACLAASHRLSVLATTQRTKLAEWAQATSEALEHWGDTLNTATSSAASVLVRQREEIWENLRHAALSVKREAARQLVETPREPSSRLPAATAAATLRILAMEWRGVAELSSSLSQAVPQVPKVAPKSGQDQFVSAIERATLALDRHSLAVVAMEQVLLRTLNPSAFDPGAMSAAMMSTIGASKAIGQAGRSMSDYLRTGFPHDAHAGAVQALHHSLQTLLPINPFEYIPRDGVLGGTIESLAHIDPGALAVKLVGSENLWKSTGAWALTDVTQGAIGVAKLAEHSVDVEQAVHHLGVAAHELGGAFGIEGLAGHIPIVTASISSVREVFLLKGGQTDVTSAVKNAGLDIAGTGIGGAAGGLAGAHVASALGLAAIPGPHSLVIVGAVGGAVAFRKVTNIIKGRPFRKAQVTMFEVAERHSETSLALTTSLYNDVSGVIHSAEKSYRRKIGEYPEVPPRVTKAIRASAISMHDALLAYVSTALLLLKEVDGFPKGMMLPKAKMRATRSALTAAQEHIARSEELIDHDLVIEAASWLTDTEAPVPTTWPPSVACAGTCDQAARAMRLAGDDYLKLACRWNVSAAKVFRGVAESIKKETDGLVAKSCEAQKPVTNEFLAANHQLRAEAGKLKISLA
jgi:hypothetical protein